MGWDAEEAGRDEPRDDAAMDEDLRLWTLAVLEELEPGVVRGDGGAR